MKKYRVSGSKHILLFLIILFCICTVLTALNLFSRDNDYLNADSKNIESEAIESWGDFTIAFNFSDGTGNNINNPKILNTAGELAYLAQRVNAKDANYDSKYYALGASIDLGGRNWIPIGYGSSTSSAGYNPERTHAFSGSLDGRGFTVNNLLMQYENIEFTESYGFFGMLKDATVKNFGITSGTAYIQSPLIPINNQWGLGGIAGAIDGATTIINCFNRANLMLKGITHPAVGGIAGYVLSIGTLDSHVVISNCFNHGNLEIGFANETRTGSFLHAGGLVGQSIGMYIDYINNYSTGKISILDGSVATNTYRLGPSIGWYDTKSTAPADINNFAIDTSTTYKGTGLSEFSGNLDENRKTGEQLKQQSTFTGYDFTNTWVISPSLNGGYPLQRAFTRRIQLDGVMGNTFTTETGKFTTPEKTSKAGYKFVSFNTKADGTGTSYAASISHPLPPYLAVGGDVITLYSIFTAEKYTGVFRSNDVGVTGTPPNNIVVEFGKKIILPSFTGNFERTGYRLTNWTTVVNGITLNFGEGESPNVWNIDATEGIDSDNATITFYAVWTPLSNMTINFEYNGATGGNTENSRSLTYGNLIGNLPKPTKTGFAFRGWYGEGSFVTQYSDENGNLLPGFENYISPAYPVTGKTLYAKFDNITYYATFHEGTGGTGTGPDRIMVIVGQTFIPPIATGTFIREGYYIESWNTKIDGTGTNFLPGIGAVWTIPEDTVLYAVWEPSPNQTIYFDYRDATGGNYIINRKVNYDAAIIDETFTGFPVPVKIGYIFEGWFNDPVSGVKFAEPDGSVVLGKEYYNTANGYGVGSTTLYAHWKAKTFNITYDLNGGTGTQPAPETAEYGKIFRFASGSGITKTGYTMTGWCNKSNPEDDGAVIYISGSSITLLFEFEENQVLYAFWTPLPNRIITFYDNGQDGGEFEYSRIVTYGDLLDRFPVPLKTGYVFEGWFINSNFTIMVADKYGELQSGYEKYEHPNYNVMGQTVYAKWTAKTFNIIFNNNGGSGEEKIKPATYYTLFTFYNINNAGFTRTGYTLFAFNTNPDATVYDVNNILPGSNIIWLTDLGDADTLTYYAIWKPLDNCIIVFDYSGADGGEIDEVLRITEYGSVLEKFPLPEKTGHLFKGWFNQASVQFTDKYSDFISGKNIFSVDNGYLIAGVVLYARWEAKTYTITYDKNSGTATGGIPGTTVIFNTMFSAAFNDPENLLIIDTGYRILRWDTQSDGLGETFMPNTPKLWQVAEDVILYAVWGGYTENEINLSYSGATSNNNIKNIRATTDKEVAKFPVPQKNGYAFAGWFFDSSLTIRVTDNLSNFVDGFDVYLIAKYLSESVTVYAKWVAKTYAILFDSNYAGGPVEEQSIDFGETVILDSSLFSRTGYIFLGYAKTPEGTPQFAVGPNNDLNLSYTLTAIDDENGVVLYAIWQAKIYTIYFDYDYATSVITEASRNVVYDWQVLMLKVPAKTGYSFAGWALSYDQTIFVSDIYGNLLNDYLYFTDRYFDADTEYTGAVELIAVWSNEKYTVTFDKNDNLASGVINPVSDLIIGGYIVLDLSYITAFTKTGYKFAGFALTKTGSAKYATGDDNSINNIFILEDANDITLYAVWIKRQYIIIYDYNGGTGSGQTDRRTVIYDELINPDNTNPLQVPILFGYKFMGWYLSDSFLPEYFVADSNGILQSGFEVFGSNWGAGDATIYALWEKQTFTLTLDKNNDDATGDSCVLDVVYEDSVLIPLDTYLLLGYILKGFSTQPEGIVEFMPGDLYWMFSENAVLYAIWEAGYFDIIFNANGGIGDDVIQTMLFNSQMTLYQNSFYRTGYSFSGWAVSETGCKIYDDEELFQLATEGITLYAVWKPDKFEITLKTDEEDPEPLFIYAYYEMKVIELKPITKEGFVFEGWFDEDGNLWTQDSIYNLTHDITLTARWLVQYKITLSGEDGFEDEILITNGLPVGNLPVLTKQNYTFMGWWAAGESGVFYGGNPELGDIQYFSYTIFEENSDITLFAVFKINIYKIVFKLETDDLEIYYETDVEAGQVAVGPEDPVKEGYRFRGWFDQDGKEIDITKPFNSDMVLTAKWQKNSNNAIYFILAGLVIVIILTVIIAVKIKKKLKKAENKKIRKNISK